jgi:hypothetical protein
MRRSALKERNHNKQRRAHNMDFHVQAAYLGRLPIRVVLLDGPKDEQTRKPTRASLRALDPERWAVTAYDWATGECAVTRGAEPQCPILNDDDEELEGFEGQKRLQLALHRQRVYKSDSKRKQTIDQRQARDDLFRKIMRGACLADYGLVVEAPACLAEDPTGDSLDALLCAIQAAWSWNQREHRFGAPVFVDPLEGWIADPKVSRLTDDRFIRHGLQASMFTHQQNT